MSVLNIIALIFFVLSIIVYIYIIEFSPYRKKTLVYKLFRSRIVFVKKLQQFEEIPTSFSTYTKATYGGVFTLTSVTTGLMATLVFFIFNSQKAANAINGLDLFYPVREEELVMRSSILILLAVYVFFNLISTNRMWAIMTIAMGSLRNKSTLSKRLRMHEGKKVLRIYVSAVNLYSRAWGAMFFLFAGIGWLFSPVLLIILTLVVLKVNIRRNYYSSIYKFVDGHKNATKVSTGVYKW